MSATRNDQPVSCNELHDDPRTFEDLRTFSHQEWADRDAYQFDILVACIETLQPLIPMSMFN